PARTSTVTHARNPIAGFQHALLPEPHGSDDRRIADHAVWQTCDFRPRPPLGRDFGLASGEDLRPSARISLAREHSSLRRPHRGQTSIISRDFRAAQIRARLRHHPQAPAHICPAVWTLPDRPEADRTRPSARTTGLAANRRRGETGVRRWATGVHLP